MTATESPLDTERVAAFERDLVAGCVATVVTLMIAIGSRSGALDALADSPATSVELAERAGLSERHLREWLAVMATAGIVDYDVVTQRYRLDPERAACLSGTAGSNVAPFAEALAFLSRFVAPVIRTLQEGGGIPGDDYQPELDHIGDQINRRLHDGLLVDGLVATIAGLAERLRAGAVVAAIGCGSGRAANALARAFPASTIVGYDASARATDAAQRQADARGLHNARFECRDVATLPPDARFDVVFAFDVIHTQPRPRRLLSEVRRVLAGDGTLVLVDVDVSSNIEDNVGNPLAPLVYGISLLFSLQVALAEGGDALGAACGRQRTTELLHRAGFADVAVLPTPAKHPARVAYVARPSHHHTIRKEQR